MALAPGAQAPPFVLIDSERRSRSLSEFLGKKTLLAFYPGAFTGVCTKEMCALRDTLAELEKLNAQIVGISPDSPFANKAFADLNRLAFPLLSDFTREVARKYCGVYEDFAGVKGYVAAKRSIFILDQKGIIRYAWVTENPGTEPDYAALREAIAAF
jgi:peroxiredoxin